MTAEPATSLRRSDLDADRWSLFEGLRGVRPHWSDEFGAWFVLDFEGVRRGLTSSELTTDHPLRSSRQIFGKTALDADGPDHRVLRRQVSWFNPADVRSYEPLVAQEVDHVFAELDLTRPIDFVRQIAGRVPARVMGRILGLDPELAESLYAELLPVFDHLDDPRSSLMDALDAADLALAVLDGIDWAPEGVVSRLLRGDRQRSLPHPEQAMRQVMLLLAAGTLTTSTGITNVVMAVGDRPEARRALETAGAGYVVNESLRWRPPLHFTLRYARHDLEWGGQSIQAGAPVQLVLAAANHDPLKFDNPAAWKVGRTIEASLAFGGGRHSCSGVNLARLEIESVLRALDDRFRAWTADFDAVTGVVFVRPRTLTLTGAPR